MNFIAKCSFVEYIY